MDELTNKQQTAVDEASPEVSMETIDGPALEEQVEVPDEPVADIEIGENKKREKADPSTTSALRISQIRRANRRRRLRKLKQGLMTMLLLVSAGLIYYGVTQSGILKVAQGSKAGASELRSHVKSDPLYDCFATVGESSLKLSLPGKDGDVVGIGFHQAERREAIAIKPAVKYFDRESTATVREAVVASKEPVLFVMTPRGRGSALTSAMDIAMVPGAAVYCPVDGVVTVVKTYNLYGKMMDYHVEIQPDGYPDLRVAIIHIDNIQVTVGQRVHRRVDQIGWMRPLPGITSQVNKYLPHQCDHVHIQVNPATLQGNMGS